MLIYRGDYINDLKINLQKKSRYGFPALFFACSIETAKMYADFYAKIYNADCGYLYTYEIAMKPDHAIDYQYKYSYSSEFRNLILALHKTKYNLVCIKNVLDFPSKDYISPVASDIYVLFDLKKIPLPVSVQSFDLMWF